METCLKSAASCISYSDSKYFGFLLNSEIDLLDLSIGMKIYWENILGIEEKSTKKNPVIICTPSNNLVQIRYMIGLEN